MYTTPLPILSTTTRFLGTVICRVTKLFNENGVSSDNADFFGQKILISGKTLTSVASRFQLLSVDVMNFSWSPAVQPTYVTVCGLFCSGLLWRLYLLG
jgi:hypothetical protein